MLEIKLREYQQTSISELFNKFNDGHTRQVLSASTGAGKSIIAMSILNSESQRCRVMFICDRRILVEQFSVHLSRHGIDHGCVMANHWRYKPYERIQVASIQTLERMRRWPEVDLIIVDEIHAVMRKSLKDYMTQHPEVKVLGLTATPFHPELGNYFTSVTNVITMEKLVQDNFLVPFKVYVAKEIDVSGVKVAAGEWQRDEVEQRSLQIVGDVVSEYVRISHEVFGGYKKTICFSSGVAHGVELASQFAKIGLNFIPISYKDSDEYKQEVLRRFSEVDTEINGIISSDILTRGFDQTDVEHVIIARPLRKSFSMHVQMVGRGARVHEGKEFCIIQDHAGNWLRFQNDWQNLFHDGTKTLSSDADTKTRKEPTEREKKEAKCPKCQALWTFKTDVCGACGFVKARMSTVAAVPGELKELEAANNKLQIDNQAFYSQLLHYAQVKGYQPGWAFYKYKERFNVAPRGLSSKTEMPTNATLGWIKSRTIAFAKSKAKAA